MLPFFVKVNGAIAKRLCTGLQIRLAQFDSGSRLHDFFNEINNLAHFMWAFLFLDFLENPYKSPLLLRYDGLFFLNKEKSKDELLQSVAYQKKSKAMCNSNY
jgi:hypothetical protein